MEARCLEDESCAANSHEPNAYQKLAERKMKSLAKAHAGYREVKEAFISTVLADARSLYEVRVLSNGAAHNIPAKP